MQPMQAAGHPQPALIQVNDRGLDQPADNGRLDRFQRLIRPLMGLGQGAQAQRLPKQIQAALPQPVKGQQLLVIKVGRRCKKLMPD